MTIDDGEGDNGGNGGDTDSGAFSQFDNEELRAWAVRLALLGLVVILALWISVVLMDLLDGTAENGLANLATVWLLTFGALAFLLGVFLQLASLRVAKLRGAHFEVKAESELGGIAKALADILKSAKVPVAAMLLGAVLMISAGVIAVESLSSDVDELIEVDLREEFEREREGVRDMEGVLNELCRRLGATDVSPRRLGDFGEMLLELCG